MIYELTTLKCPLLALNEASDGAQAWVSDPEAKGTFLGCWRTDIGTLGQLLVLRGFETPEQLLVERGRALLSASPFNGGNTVTSLSMESYSPFPFLRAVRPAAFGKIYEFRTYRLKPGGLQPTLAGWQEAIEPALEYTAHLVINMYAIDGAPRITHIWGFQDLEQRMSLRAKSYAAGVWPPQGGPAEILEATSTIGLSESYSPLS